jgi:DNA mismatch endonuclease (patch repair protein)
MTDTLTKAQRSKLMSKVRGRDTKPEWILRCGLHRLGFRYRLRNNRLPGRPDLVFHKFGAVVFVHGCFWHRHRGCKVASTPKSNVDFWNEKFANTVKRDRRVKRALERNGWRVLVVWECELLGQMVEIVWRVATWLRQDANAEEASSGAKYVVDRTELLAVAEEKVRYRIDSYGDKPQQGASDAAEG